MSAKEYNLRRQRFRRGSAERTPVSTERIDALTSTGRANWLALLAFLSFSLITTLGVSDVDFFVNDRQTQLPLVGVAIPTVSFFVFAPILGAALYVYLHLHICKATEALAEAATGSPPLEETIKPWLLNDYVLRHRADPAIRSRPLDWLANLSTLLLIWIAAPLVLLLMWWRTWPAHSLELTSVSGVAIVLSVFVGLRSWKKLRQDMGRPTRFLPVLGLSVVVAVVVLGRGYTATSGWVPPIVNPKWPIEVLQYGLIARADMRSASVSELPLDTRDHVAAHLAFRRDWCALRHVSSETCSGLTTPTAQAPRFDPTHFRACARSRDFATCFREAAPKDAALFKDWKAYRKTQIDALRRPNLSGRDLAGAHLKHAALVGVDVYSADLRGVELVSARLEQADIRSSDLTRASLHQADLRGAFFFWANLERARFGFANLQAAEFHGASGRRVDFGNADLEGAKLDETVLHDAGFSRAILDHVYMYKADLSDAHFGGTSVGFVSAPYANFDETELQQTKVTGGNFTYASFRDAFLYETKFVGTRLAEVDFTGARFIETVLQAVVATGADFRGAENLSQAQLNGVIGNERTLLPESADAETGEQLYVLSCLPAQSTGWENLTPELWRRSGEDPDAAAGLLNDILCDPGEVPRKTGLPWHNGAPPWKTNPDWTAPDRGPVDEGGAPSD